MLMGVMLRCLASLPSGADLFPSPACLEDLFIFFAGYCRNERQRKALGRGKHWLAIASDVTWQHILSFSLLLSSPTSPADLESFRRWRSLGIKGIYTRFGMQFLQSGCVREIRRVSHRGWSTQHAHREGKPRAITASNIHAQQPSCLKCNSMYTCNHQVVNVWVVTIGFNIHAYNVFLIFRK